MRARLVVAALVLLPAGALSANAGTPLILASVLHLTLGNLLLGALEGLALERWLRVGPTRVGRWIGLMIVANIASTAAGHAGLGAYSRRFIRDVGDVPGALLPLCVLAFFLTQIVELPFALVLSRFSGAPFRRAVLVSFVVQSVSCTAVFAWFASASRTSLATGTRFVDARDIAFPSGFQLFALDGSGGAFSWTPEGGRIPVRERTASSPEGLLRAEKGGSSGIEIAAYTPAGAGSREPVRSVLRVFEEGEAPIGDPDHTPTNRWDAWGRAPRLGSKGSGSMSCMVGFWPSNGLSCWDEAQADGSELSLRLEIVGTFWHLRCPVLVNDEVLVFQLGEDQICALHLPTKRLALLARGSGPAAVISSSGDRPARG